MEPELPDAARACFFRIIIHTKVTSSQSSFLGPNKIKTGFLEKITNRSSVCWISSCFCTKSVQVWQEMDRILQEVLDGACGSGVRRGQNAEPAENPVGENAKMLNL